MSELKSFIVLYDGKFIRAYEESEADKAIADLEESHKKEVEQLLIEIAELKDSIGKLLKAKTEQVMDEVFQKCLIYGEGFVPAEHAMRLVAELRHNKYKRCLAMADMCAERRMYWTYRLQDDGDKGYSKDYKFGKNCFWRKWCVRWLALADKFKDKEAK